MTTLKNSREKSKDKRKVKKHDWVKVDVIPVSIADTIEEIKPVKKAKKKTKKGS